ncbi:MAG: hypothetical protein R3F29_10275 [Planctomycetota bacterium]
MLRRLAVLVPLLTLALPAQADRHELGLRLRAFERRLAACDDPTRRDAALVELDRAVQAFFRLDTATVAQAVARADAALDGAPRSDAKRFADSLALALAARLVDAAAETVEFELRSVFKVVTDDADEDEVEAPRDLTLTVTLPGSGPAPLRVTIDELPFTGELSLRGIAPGDHTLRWSITQGDAVLVEREQGLSIAADLDARLAKLRDLSIEPESIESATLPSLVRLLDGMRRKRPEETVLRGAHMLAEAEALVTIPAPFYGGERSGDFRLRVPTASATETVRLFVPPDLDGPRPLVIAVHGAGGSENLFFDGYGDGEVVRQAAQRGWLVAAPRVGFGQLDCAALADALADRFPIDRSRVLLVGHSMGAMQVIGNAMRTPASWAAVAALGGGGQVRASDALKKLPLFVGVGSRDFALEQARSLHRALRRAGVNSLLREFPGVEHLSVVQLALPEVFAFFDAVLAGGK